MTTTLTTTITVELTLTFSGELISAEPDVGFPLPDVDSLTLDSCAINGIGVGTTESITDAVFNAIGEAYIAEELLVTRA